MKNKATIHSDNAPQAVGAYSQAIKVGDTVYLSGQIPLKPNTSELVPGEFEKQARQVFSNLLAVCQSAGGDFSNIVKLVVYLTDLDNFTMVNTLMAELFNNPYPARATVGVSQLPKGASIEIEGVMVL